MRAFRVAGRVIALAGGVLWIATLIALVAGLSDRAGALVVLVVATLLLLSLLAWATAYAHRYHPRPVRPRQPLATTDPSTVTLADQETISARVVDPEDPSLPAPVVPVVSAPLGAPVAPVAPDDDRQADTPAAVADQNAAVRSIEPMDEPTIEEHVDTPPARSLEIAPGGEAASPPRAKVATPDHRPLAADPMIDTLLPMGKAS